jgi:murein DD-endopeptidase MepM/ murein hydrolase activator NlpD
MRRAVVTIAFVVLGLAGFASAGTLPPTIVLKWLPERPVQGSLIAIEAIPATDSAAALQGKLAGEPLHFERSDNGSFRALGAIPLDAKTTARGTVHGADGAITALAVPVTRRGGRMERLRAAERFARKPDSVLLARLARERAQIGKVLDSTHERPRLWTDAWIRPLPGRVLSGFGTPRVFNNVVESRHKGVDFWALLGDSIRVANRGVVALVADHYYAGRSVWVDHGAGLVTVYLHLSKALVAKGDTVALGQIIGLVGNTGRVTAPHLHWSALYGGISVDPMDLLGPTVNHLASRTEASQAPATQSPR